MVGLAFQTSEGSVEKLSDRRICLFIHSFIQQTYEEYQALLPGVQTLQCDEEKINCSDPMPLARFTILPTIKSHWSMTWNDKRVSRALRSSAWAGAFTDSLSLAFLGCVPVGTVWHSTAWGCCLTLGFNIVNGGLTGINRKAKLWGYLLWLSANHSHQTSSNHRRPTNEDPFKTAVSTWNQLSCCGTHFLFPGHQHSPVINTVLHHRLLTWRLSLAQMKSAKV